MEKYFYLQSVRRTFLGFLNIFKDINIRRYNNDQTIADIIKIPLKIAPSGRFYSWMKDLKFNKILPIMAGSLEGMIYDDNRTANIDYKFIIEENDYKEYLRYLNPVPYKFSFKLSCLSKYMTDTDQILEQILPYFAPFSVYRLSYPELNINLNVKLTLDSMDFDLPKEISWSANKINACNFSFTAESWIFYPIEDAKLIEKIVIPYYTEHKLPHGFDTLTVNKEEKQLEGEFIKRKEVQYFEGAIEDGKKVVEYEIFDDE